MAFYDAEHWQLKANYNYRDDFLQQSQGLQGQPEMVEDYGQLDVSIDYKANKKLSFYININNVLNAKYRSYSIHKERLLRYEETGTAYRAGMRFQF